MPHGGCGVAWSCKMREKSGGGGREREKKKKKREMSKLPHRRPAGVADNGVFLKSKCWPGATVSSEMLSSNIDHSKESCRSHMARISREASRESCKKEEEKKEQTFCQPPEMPGTLPSPSKTKKGGKNDNNAYTHTAHVPRCRASCAPGAPGRRSQRCTRPQVPGDMRGRGGGACGHGGAGGQAP